MEEQQGYTLALDTVTDSISVAVLDGADVMGQNYQMMERGQGEALVPMIQAVMRDAGLSMKQIGRVAVSVGPGSFTGVRIGLATARGIGLALNVPVVGVSTLEARAYQSEGAVMVAIDTKRGDFYTQQFQDGKAYENPIIRTEEQIKAINPKTIIGSWLDGLKEQGCHVMEPDYCPAVQVGLCALNGGREPEPIYLRDADVSC